MTTLSKTAELEQIFFKNLTIKENDDGSLYVETYGKIDSPTQYGSCRYGQYYKVGTSRAEAQCRFTDYYLPMNLADNGIGYHEFSTYNEGDQ